MPIPSYLIGRDGDMCRCGRIASRPHCPLCGVFKVAYKPSLTRRTRDSITQEVKETKWFVCEKCGHHFDRWGSEFCEAPVYETKIARVRAEIVRTKHEVASGHPLTEREEIISEALDITSRIPATDILTPEEERRHRLDWVKKQLETPRQLEYAVSVDEFLKQKAEEKLRSLSS